MINLDKIFIEAIERNASDIHLVEGRKPMLRVTRVLEEIEDEKVLDEEDMYEIYDFFVRGQIDKDEEYKLTKRLDFSYKFEKDEEYKLTKKLDFSYKFDNVRFRGNISSADDVPVVTLRLIKNELPAFEDLGVPDVVRRTIYQPNGLILVTGKTNSGKTTTLNALIDEVNKNEKKKILSLEKPIEYKHVSKKSLIVQKEVGRGKDVLSYKDGVKNALREDCDILVIRRD